ncbi:MAG: hypothetical protein H6797_03740 [Candidatus Nomurabacteria bacterium]|nr:MAG: hypothetical protein H6797_03740 [Candidatus Nomurabacteria bacterium]
MAEYRPALEKNMNSDVLKRSVKVGLASAALVGFIFNSTAVANADPTVYVGGACDGASQFPVDHAKQAGTYDYGADNYQVQWSGALAPVCGNERMIDSVNDQANQIVDFYHRHQGDPSVRAYGFSEGAVGVDQASMRLAAENGGQLPANFHPETAGDATTPIGLLDHPLAGVISPITGLIGIPGPNQIHPVPGTVVNLDKGDWYATGNVDPFNLGDQITKMARIPQDHRMPFPGEPHQTVVVDGVTYNVFGSDTNGISRAIREAGADPTFIGDAFFNTIAPQPDPTKKLNVIKSRHESKSNVESAVKSVVNDVTTAVTNSVASSGQAVQNATSQVSSAASTITKHVINTGHGTVTPNVQLVAKPTTFAHH